MSMENWSKYSYPTVFRPDMTWFGLQTSGLRINSDNCDLWRVVNTNILRGQTNEYNNLMPGCLNYRKFRLLSIRDWVLCSIRHIFPPIASIVAYKSDEKATYLRLNSHMAWLSLTCNIHQIIAQESINFLPGNWHVFVFRQTPHY